MKTFIPLIAFGLVCFCALVWFLQTNDADADLDDLTVNREEQDSTRIDSLLSESGAPKGRRNAAREVTVETLGETKDDENELTTGELWIQATVGVAKSDDVRVSLIPPAGRYEHDAEGHRFFEVPPGRYSVKAEGQGLIPRVEHEVDVEVGMRTRLTMGLEPGWRFAGRVMHADKKRVIPFADVEFVGFTSIRTDEGGYFDTGSLLPRRALRMIKVTADHWDQLSLKHYSVPDPTDLRLYLGGGPCEARVEIANQTGDVVPTNARLKVTIPPLYEVRRDLALDGRTRQTIANLYESMYRFELHFPGGEFPTLYRELKIEGEEGNIIRFELAPGATLSGATIGPAMARSGVAVELRQGRNLTQARTSVDAEGRYEFRHLKPGAYQVFLVDRMGEKALGQIELSLDDVVERDIDLLRKRFRPKS